MRTSASKRGVPRDADRRSADGLARARETFAPGAPVIFPGDFRAPETLAAATERLAGRDGSIDILVAKLVRDQGRQGGASMKASGRQRSS